MKIVQINAVCGTGSTGKICVAVSELLTQNGVENYILYSQGVSDYPLGIKYMSKTELKLQALFSRIFGNYGFNSRLATKRLIRHLERIRPDVVHLHNLHGHNCNLEMLFRYLKRKGVKLFGTFHDCWALTGYCTHYDLIGCDRWKTECKNCPQRKQYSWFLDKSHRIFQRKKSLFTGLNLTIVSPSEWMAAQVKRSFLKDYPIKVIHNGIDLDVFKPRESDFRKRYNIPEHKKIILGVASGWSYAKGLDVFVKLAEMADNEFQIVMVGTDDGIDKQLPSKIISIHRTQNQKALAEIYTAADVFINPTREDTFPTVNIEALACGTPVVTFRTGGSPEILDETCGFVVEKGDVTALVQAVYRISNLTREACREHALQFDMHEKFCEYLKIYS